MRVESATEGEREAPPKPQLLLLDRGVPGKWQLLLLDKERVKFDKYSMNIDSYLVIRSQ